MSRPLSTLHAALAVTLVVAATSLAVGACVEIEPDPPVDEEGEPIPMPDPYDPWLEIVDISPSSDEIALSPTVAVTFNDYIDDDAFDSYAFGALRSGGVGVSGTASYVMTDKTVVWRPYAALEPGLVYRFSVTAEPVSATGAPLREPSAWPTYMASRDAAPIEPVELPEVRWDAVAPIFEAKCASCHHDPQWGLNPLTYDSLIGAKSQQTDLFLVRPGDAPDSYLMRKLLWDYADVEFVHQPPKWSGGEELGREELLTIEGWIAGGALR
jgi:hypothetical protein